MNNVQKTKAEKYAMEAVSIKGKKTTLGIETLLYPPSENDKPLTMHSNFSRMKFTLINKEGDSTYTVSANIPAREIYSLKTITDAVINSIVSFKMQPKIQQQRQGQTEQQSSSPAYIVPIANGIFKGKTPAEVLLNNQNDKTGLEQQLNWLQNNLAKYPNNKKQIDAILDAFKLFQENKLKKDAVSNKSLDVGSLSTIDIYRADIRIPHATKTDKNGNTDVYSMNIICDPNKNYPFTINIVNMLAPPIIGDNGLVTANLKQAVNKKVCSISLSDRDWINTVNALYNRITEFENAYFPSQWKKAYDLSYKFEDK